MPHLQDFVYLVLKIAVRDEVYTYFAKRYGYEAARVDHLMHKYGLSFPKYANKDRPRSKVNTDISPARVIELQEMSLKDLRPWGTARALGSEY